MADIKGISIKIGGDTTALTKALADVNKSSKDIQTELKQVEKLLKLDPKNTELVAQKQKLLADAVENSKAKLEALRKAQKDVDAQFAKGEISEGQYRAFQREVAAAEQEVSKFEKQLKSTGLNAEQLGKQIQDAGQKMTDVGKNLSMKVTAPIVGLGAAATKASIDLESAFTGVIKTVDATEAELAVLKQGFIDMSREIPIATGELYGIGEAAGQLGIKTENILGFTEVMAKLGVTTNMSSDEAATALARLANITGMPQTEFEKLGSTVVALGNNLATTEGEIVEMGLRIAGAGAQVGMTEAQILSFAGALSSVGINAEAGGTAISKLMIDIASEVETGGKKLSGFAEVAGMTSEQFQKAFRDDAASAIIAFIGGLGKMKDNGEDVFGVIDDLGLSEIRLRDALLRASGASDLFSDSLELGSAAWEENTALTKEAELRFGTTAAKLQIFQNEVKLLAASFGEVLAPVLTNIIQALRPLIESFGQLSEGQKTTIVMVAGLVAAIGPLLLILGPLVTLVGSVTATIGAMTAASAAGATGIGIFSAGFPILGAAIAAITLPIAATIAAITALIAIGVALYKNWDDLVFFGKKTWTALQVGWASGMESIKKAFTDFGASIAAKMNEIGAGLIAKWEELKNGIIAKAEALKSGVSAKWDEIKAGIAEKAAAITSDVIAKWEELKNGVIAKVSALKSGVSAKWDEIRANTISKLTEIRDQAIQWGKNIIQGLIDGIKSKLGAARDAVATVGEGIKNKIKSMFDIHSPSRVTYEMGENITQGLADGISDTAGVAISAANSLAGQVSNALQQANADLAALQAAAAAARAAAQARNDAINKEGDDAAAGVGVEPSNDPAILNKAQQIYDVSFQVAADLAELDSMIASDPKNADKYKEAQKIIFKDFIAAGGLPRYLDPKYADAFNYAYDYIHHGPNSEGYTEDIQIMKAVQDLIAAGGAATVTPGSSVGAALDEAAANLAARAAAKAQGDTAKAQVNALASQHNQLVYDIRERGVKDYDGTIAAQISALASQIASLIGQIETLDKQAGIRGWNPPTLEQMYMFASGGIVTRPTMAMVGEAGESEAVLPLSNLLPMMTDALLGAVATLGGSTSTITNSTRQVILQIINQGTIVGRNGMEEFARTVSQEIGKDFGLSVGGSW